MCETCAAAAGGAVGLAGPELPVRRTRLGLGTGWSLSTSAPAAFRKATASSAFICNPNQEPFLSPTPFSVCKSCEDGECSEGRSD